MRHVEFDPEKLPAERRVEWDAWLAVAAAAQSRLQGVSGEGESPSFDSRVWKTLKEWYFEHVFHGKCAYCEAETDVVAAGDGEHWRPKGAVTTIDRGVVLDPAGTPHPGYWWLAYDWRNLLPACERCNRGKGKGTRFPVKNDYVFSPSVAQDVDDLDAREGPLLLHPFRGPDPAKHLDFNQLGQPVGLTEVGEASVKVFDLARHSLNRAREQRCSLMRGVADQVLTKWINYPERPPGLLKALVEEHVDERGAFTLARKNYLWSHVRERIDRLAGEAS